MELETKYRIVQIITMAIVIPVFFIVNSHTYMASALMAVAILLSIYQSMIKRRMRKQGVNGR
ncbi:hypothetical protein Q7A53_09970 [Halobacillus rhizosphaerae]|uniref:hypothetical protein n=1 Tax=Halobacillus rhizosphaerae TaxID=3064889 RepID=UPI00398AD311